MCWFLRFCVCKQFVTSIEKANFKKDQIFIIHTCGIAPKHVTSGGAHLCCAYATQFQTLKKASQRWRASHTDSDAFNHYAKRSVKGKFEFEFLHVLRIIKATKKHKVYSFKYHTNIKLLQKNRSCGKSGMMGRSKLRQTLTKTADWWTKDVELKTLTYITLQNAQHLKAETYPLQCYWCPEARIGES